MFDLLINFALGLGLLIWGMRLLKTGLENAAGQGFKQAIQKLTTNPVNGMLTGTVITALIQSSTAVSVFSISLVNAKLMTFEQALGIILGTNIGSTVTAQLMAFDLQVLALPAIALGGFLFILSRRSWRWLGLGLVGFGLVFLGIGAMAKGLEPLSSSPNFLGFLNHLGNNHLYGVGAGAALAGLIHSSGVTTGMVIVLASQNMITLPTAIAIVLGANVGTCLTAILAAIGGDIGAKRVAVAHVLLNLVGVLVFLPFLTPYARMMTALSSDLGRQVANAHTFFNIFSSLAILPFISPFVRLIYTLVPDKNRV
jgi:phosphate:Na+ symporter